MFSAYDLKKIIPRAVFALVAANLSWSLMEVAIGAVNTLGDGAKELVLAPFGQTAALQLTTGGNLGLLGISVLAVGGAALGLIPVAGVALAGLGGLLFAFIVILARRIALLGLVIIAPVAIALMVFPQTEKWAKEWWEWFLKLLLMYPFIMGFFGLAQVAAGITSRGGNALYQIAAFAIIIIPYFLIGKALSLAGGTISKFAGAINDPSKGLVDRGKKWDGDRVTRNRADAKAGSRYSDRFGTRTVNRALGVAGNKGSRVGAANNFQKRVASLKETNPEIESLTGEEAKLLAESHGSSSGLDAAVEAEVKKQKEEIEKKGGRADVDAIRRQVRTTAKSAKQKSGGVDAVRATLALQKAVEAGAITDGATIGRHGVALGATALGVKDGGALGT